MSVRISLTTAETVGAMALSMGKTGALPQIEAKAVMKALQEAARKSGQDTAPKEKSVRLLTTKQAAERLGCSRRTVLRMLDDGTLTRRYLRPGKAKSLRISAEDIDAMAGKGGLADD